MFYFLLIDSMVNTGDSTLFQLIQLQFAKISWTLVAYIIFAIITTGMGVKILMPMGSQRAIIFGIGAVLIFVFYYYRWFPTGNKTVANWPPNINSCPDYLTYVKNLPGSSPATPGCVDLLGIRSSVGGIEKIASTKLSKTPLEALLTTEIFPFTSKDVLSGDVDRVKQICTECRLKGVTWEGVWDGDACIGIATQRNLSNSPNPNCPR